MKKIACIGNITFDILAYTNGFPKEDTRVNYNELIMGYGGPAINASTVIDKFDQSVDFYGVLGNDIFSSLILDELIKTNINTKIIFKENFMPPINYIIISENNKTRTINSYILHNEQNIIFNNLEDDYDFILTDGKHYQSTINLFVKNKDAIKIIDAGRCNDFVIDICKKCDYVICSKEFANDFMHKFSMKNKIDFSNTNSINIILKFLQNHFKNSKVVITLGEEGYIYLDDKNLVKENALHVEDVKDTNGAGDIFHGAFTYALANDYSFKEALQFANVTSSLSVAKKGGKTSCPELKEIKKYKKIITK